MRALGSGARSRWLARREIGPEIFVDRCFYRTLRCGESSLTRVERAEEVTAKAWRLTPTQATSAQHCERGIREQVRSNLAFRVRFHDYRELIGVLPHERPIDGFDQRKSRFGTVRSQSIVSAQSLRRYATACSSRFGSETPYPCA